jgi:hypothetical protein
MYGDFHMPLYVLCVPDFQKKIFYHNEHDEDNSRLNPWFYCTRLKMYCHDRNYQCLKTAQYCSCIRICLVYFCCKLIDED